jgi:iron complex outermembrane receptor protein
VDTLHNNNGPNPGIVPSYIELEARLAWQISASLQLAVVGQNLLHERHPEYGFPSATRAEVERNVLGRLVWHR